MGPGGFRGGLRGAPRGLGRGLRGGFRGGGFRGGFGAQAGGRDFSNQDIYADYSGPDQQAAPGGGGLRMDGYGSGGHAYAGGVGAGYGAGFAEAEPSQQIMVRNVRTLRVPWQVCTNAFVTA